MRVSVIVPIFRSQVTIRALSEQVRAILADHQLELIFVNDASPDDSDQVLKEIASQEHIMVLAHEVNQGQYAAILSGLRLCSGELVIVMDADLQDDPMLVPQMISAYSQNGGAVFVKRKGLYQGRLRMVTSRVFKSLVQILTGLDYRAGSFF